jgi:glutamate dehydrogenase
VLPVLENMGVRVVDERPYEVRPVGRAPVWIYDFGLRHGEEAEFQADDVREAFQDSFARAWRGETEDDGFNRLVLSARLTAREIVILRAIAKYMRQAGSTFSQAYMEDALAAHPAIARRIVDLFCLRHEPERFADTDAKARALDREIEDAIDGVASLDDDRILRGFLRVLSSSPGSPSRARSSRCSSTRRARRASTCAAGGSPAAASAGPTGARTFAPRCSG